MRRNDTVFEMIKWNDNEQDWETVAWITTREQWDNFVNNYPHKTSKWISSYEEANEEGIKNKHVVYIVE